MLFQLLSWPEDVMVRVRMGIHTGEPLLLAEGYIGLDVHCAARIMSGCADLAGSGFKDSLKLNDFTSAVI